MTKLNQDQKEELAELLDSPAWEAVLALCQISVENHENRVLTCDMTANDRELVLRKARLEGARDMQRSIHNVREAIGMTKKRERKING